MIRRIGYGALIVGSLAGIYLLDAHVLPRPVIVRVLLLVMTLGALREVLGLGGRKVETAPGLFLFGAVGVITITVPALVTGSPVSPALLALAAFAAGAIRLVGMAPLRSAPVAFPEAVMLAAAVAYTAGLLSFLDRLLAEDVTRGMVVVLVSKTSDMCGYLVGSTIGRKRIVPAISPKKTWEGTIAGVLGSAGVAALLSHELAGPPWFAATIGGLVGAASFLGDLTASGLKRWSGAKDSARLVPEFGGFLDMVDGILLAAPVAVLCLHGW